jgi:hypothetical protein
MRLQHFALCAASLALPASAVEAQAWHEVASVKDLPFSVQQQLGVGDEDDAIADRGEPFNASCVVFDKTPRKRFVLGAMRGDTVMVAVEFGGLALHTQSIAFLRSGQDWIKQETRPLGRLVTLQELTQGRRGPALSVAVAAN